MCAKYGASWQSRCLPLFLFFVFFKLPCLSALASMLPSSLPSSDRAWVPYTVAVLQVSFRFPKSWVRTKRFTLSDGRLKITVWLVVPYTTSACTRLTFDQPTAQTWCLIALLSVGHSWSQNGDKYVLTSAKLPGRQWWKLLSWGPSIVTFSCQWWTPTRI